MWVGTRTSHYRSIIRDEDNALLRKLHGNVDKKNQPNFRHFSIKKHATIFLVAGILSYFTRFRFFLLFRFPLARLRDKKYLCYDCVQEKGFRLIASRVLSYCEGIAYSPLSLLVIQSYAFYVYAPKLSSFLLIRSFYFLFILRRESIGTSKYSDMLW